MRKITQTLFRTVICTILVFSILIYPMKIFAITSNPFSDNENAEKEYIDLGEMLFSRMSTDELASHIVNKHFLLKMHTQEDI